MFRQVATYIDRSLFYCILDQPVCPKGSMRTCDEALPLYLRRLP
jgi:hypothetical protein